MNNTARNDTTGDLIMTGPSNASYRDGWDLIYGKKKEASPPQLVLAGATWCGPCMMLKKNLQTLGLFDDLQHKDADADHNFFKAHDIKSVPRLFVFNEDGVVLENISGSEEILKRIKDHAGV